MTWRNYAKQLLDVFLVPDGIVILDGDSQEVLDHLTQSSAIFTRLDELHPGFPILRWDDELNHFCAPTTRLDFTELFCAEVRAYWATSTPVEAVTS